MFPKRSTSCFLLTKLQYIAVILVNNYIHITDLFFLLADVLMKFTYKVFLCLPSLNSNWWFLLVMSVTECLSSGTSAVIVMKKIGISKIHPYSLHRTTASISDQDTKISSLNMERAWDDNCIKKFVDACLKLKILKKNRHGFVSAFATQKFHTFSKSILPSMLYPKS